jgi:omega-amidase
MTLRIAMMQSNILFGKPEENLSIIEDQAAQAASDHAELMLLPELCLHGYHKQSITPSSDFHLPTVLTRLEHLSKSLKLAIAGSFVEYDGSEAYNSMIFINTSGHLIGKYRKTHLFKKLNEDKFFIQGNSLTVIETEWGRMGMAICYDLRFPEIFRKMMASGAKGFLICSEWPIERILHWKTMLQARAIENLAWIAACNCAGQTGKVTFGGQSALVDPWGDIITAGENPALFTVDIDPTASDRVRYENPFLDDYRVDIQ